MNTVCVQLPTTLYEKLNKIAITNEVSIDQLVLSTIVEKISAVEYIQKRANRSSQKDFENALAEIPDVEPEDYDKL